jgi:hypothetical protein
MNNEDFQVLARQGALNALKALAAIAVDPTAVASDREHARSMVELRLEQASNDIPPRSSTGDRERAARRWLVDKAERERRIDRHLCTMAFIH